MKLLAWIALAIGIGLAAGLYSISVHNREYLDAEKANAEKLSAASVDQCLVMAMKIAARQLMTPGLAIGDESKIEKQAEQIHGHIVAHSDGALFYLDCVSFLSDRGIPTDLHWPVSPDPASQP